MSLTRRSFTASAVAASLAPFVARRGAMAQAAPISVVATFSILGDLVQRVGGDLIALEVLVGPDSDAHTFEPSPEDIATVADAALIVENGAGFEPWLDDIYEASGSAAVRTAVTDGLTLLHAGDHAPGEDAPGEDAPGEDAPGEDAPGEDAPGEDAPGEDAPGEDAPGEDAPGEDAPGEDAHGEDAHGEDEHDEDEHGAEKDPHAWHDVTRVIGEIGFIRDALGVADPAHADAFTANHDAYAAELAELDHFAREEAAKLPAERRKLVTSHDSLGYLAAAYGFEIVGTALGSLSTETSDPSAGEIAALIEEIKAAGVPAIFAENVAGDDLMEQIAQDAGVALAPRLFTDALSEPGGGAENYVEMVRYNMTTIVAALGA